MTTESVVAGDLGSTDLQVRDQPAQSVVERWIEEGEDKALARIDTLINVLDKLRRASIKATQPSDWICHVSRDSEGTILAQRCYLQDIGAERAGKVWGIQVGAPAIEREDFPDGTFAYHMIAEATCRTTGERLDYVEGSRWSGDKFFQKGLQDGERPDPVDIRKASWANTHGRAVRQLGGLGGVPLDLLAECGLDTKKVQFVDYAKGSKGGESTGASTGGSEIVIKWGAGKDKSIAEQTDKDLAYYLKAAQKDLTDESKAKFKKNNERMIAALTAEIEKRTKTKEQAKETGEPTPSNAKPLAERRTETWKRLSKIANETGTNWGDILEAITGKRAIGDLDEKMLATVEAASDEDLNRTALATSDARE